MPIENTLHEMKEVGKARSQLAEQGVYVKSIVTDRGEYTFANPRWIPELERYDLERLANL